MSKRFVSDLEDFQYRLSCAVDAVDAIHDCMVNGPQAADAYVNALNATILMLKNLTAELAGMVDCETESGKSTGIQFTDQEKEALRNILNTCFEQYSTSGGDIDYAECGHDSPKIVARMLKKLEEGEA